MLTGKLVKLELRFLVEIFATFIIQKQRKLISFDVARYCRDFVCLGMN